MSGTNDDFMSSVNAGLEAYKDGSRIVKQIKARRQGHTVLPPEHNLEPEDNLELPLAKATGDIRQVVTQGIDRYGSSFGEGDMSTIATSELTKATITTHSALLRALTQAREADGVIDIQPCIVACDYGRVEVLIALHAFIHRKLGEEREELERERNPQMAQGVPKAQSPTPKPPAVTKSSRKRGRSTSTASKKRPATIASSRKSSPTGWSIAHSSLTWSSSTFRRAVDRLRTFDNAILPADNAVPLADDGFMQAGDAFTLADDAFMLADINAFPPADFNAHALRDNAFPVPLKPGIPSKERTRRPSQRSRDL